MSCHQGKLSVQSSNRPSTRNYPTNTEINARHASHDTNTQYSFFFFSLFNPVNMEWTVFAHLALYSAAKHNIFDKKTNQFSFFVFPALFFPNNFPKWMCPRDLSLLDSFPSVWTLKYCGKKTNKTIQKQNKKSAKRTNWKRWLRIAVFRHCRARSKSKSTWWIGPTIRPSGIRSSTDRFTSKRTRMSATKSFRSKPGRLSVRPSVSVCVSLSLSLYLSVCDTQPSF